jgi:Bifunctional DNA primase/polymerase, N-terminal
VSATQNIFANLKLVSPIKSATATPAAAEKSLLDYALDCIRRGWYVFPCYPGKKVPAGYLVPNGFKDASNDEAVIRGWWNSNPNLNPAIACGESNLVVYDFDSGKPPADLPLTFTVRTGREPVNGNYGLHMYYAGSCESHKIVDDAGNVIGDVKSRGGYVLADGAVHPSGNLYTLIDDAPLATSPENSDAKPVVKGEAVGSDEQNEIAGYVEAAFEASGIDYEVRTNHKAGFIWLIVCPWRDEHTSGKDFDTSSAVIMWPDGKLIYECKHAHCNKTRQWKELRAWMEQTVGGKLVFGRAADVTPVQTAGRAEPGQEQLDAIYARLDTSAQALRPEFPTWVLAKTSLNEGLVDPVVKSSAKFQQFVFLAGVQLFLNSLAWKVRINGQLINLNMFLGYVSPAGKFFKSSSAELAQKYFNEAGLLAKLRPSVTNADGKIMVAQAGSPEGFGLAMTRVNGSRGLLYYDELSTYVSKAGIEGSSLANTLLTYYGAGDTGNLIKSQKESFSFEAGSYCFSWLWCTTTKGFRTQWPKIAQSETGIADRMFFVLSPKQPKAAGLYHDPYLGEASRKTRALIDKAIDQGNYYYEDLDFVQEQIAGLNPRSQEMLQKLALYFAVDLGRDDIGNECVARARALVDYRQRCHAFLDPIEADNPQARLQQEMIQEIRRNGGKMTRRSFCQNLHSSRAGSNSWAFAYNGISARLNSNGELVPNWASALPPNILEWTERTESGRTTRMVGLLKQEEGDPSELEVSD